MPSACIMKQKTCDKKGMGSWKNRSPVRDELGTAEAALGRAGRAGVCEHDEGVACRRVDLIASYREKGKNLRLRRRAEELSQASTNNIVHVFTRGLRRGGLSPAEAPRTPVTAELGTMLGKRR